MQEKKSLASFLHKAQKICSLREHCLEDIRQKLQLWHVSALDIPKILTQLVSDNFINEERFCAAFVHDKFVFNKWGKLRLESELKAKRIDNEHIRNALSKINEEEYLSTLKELIRKKSEGLMDEEPISRKQKIKFYLMQKGYEPQQILTCLN